MAITDPEALKQIRHMIAFIDQEASEKAEEIDAKAEEEFNIEKGRLVQQQRVKIREYYDRKEKQIELQKKIQNSNLQNGGRLRVLKCREDHINHQRTYAHSELKDDARKQLTVLSQDQNNYKNILEFLITQGLFQLLEDQVVIRCRQKDQALVQEVLSKAIDKYKAETKKDVKVTILNTNFLSPEIAGGIEMSNPSGKIRVENTLESRMELMCQQMLPELKELLFGANPNRKFRD